VRAHQNTSLCDLPEHRIELITSAPTLGRVVPDKHPVNAVQLGRDFVRKVVVVHGGLRGDASGLEGVEQGGEAALARVGTITHRAVAGVEQRYGSRAFHQHLLHRHKLSAAAA